MSPVAPPSPTSRQNGTANPKTDVTANGTSNGTPKNTTTSPSPTQPLHLKHPLRFTTLILDFGDVLCLYADTKAPIPLSPFEVKHILGSDWWHLYETGFINREECLSKVSEYYKLAPGALAESIEILAGEARYDEGLIEFVREVKKEEDGEGLRVLMASNISREDWERLKSVVEGWEIFDGYCLSFEIGLRKPSPDFFTRMIEKHGIDPSRALFVDDKQENAAFAQIAGITSIVHRSSEETIDKLGKLMGDAGGRGIGWLENEYGKGPMWDWTDTGREVQCQFTQLVMLQMHGRRDLVKIKDGLRTWNTFFDKPILTTAEFPDDLDSTTFALMLLDVSGETKRSVMDEMLTLRNEEGLFNSYFDPHRWRLCPAVNANILRLFFSTPGRAKQVLPVISFLESYLTTYAFTKGTRYYNLVDWIFWILSLLFQESTPCQKHLLKGLREMTVLRLKERMGRSAGAFGCALRVAAARNLGLENQRDLEVLLDCQVADGGWDGEIWLFRWGRLAVQSGSRAVLTSAVVAALKGVDEEMIGRALVNIV